MSRRRQRRGLVRRWRRSIAIAAALTTGAIAATAATDPLPGGDTRALLERAFDNLYGDDYVQKLWLRTSRGEGQDMSRQLQVTRKQSVRPGKALIRFLEPYSVRKTSILVLENDRKADDHYVYLPAARRTMHLAAAQRADSFFGTDFAYEDLEPKDAEDFEVALLRVDEACAVLEITPRPHFESGYDKMVSCIEPERGVVRWTDFHRDGKAVKRLEVDLARVEPIEERFIPFRMTMSTPARRSRTIADTEVYELRPLIPDELFNVRNLETGDASHDARRAGPRASVVAEIDEAPPPASGRAAGEETANAVTESDPTDAASLSGGIPGLAVEVLSAYAYRDWMPRIGEAVRGEDGGSPLHLGIVLRLENASASPVSLDRRARLAAAGDTPTPLDVDHMASSAPPWPVALAPGAEVRLQVGTRAGPFVPIGEPIDVELELTDASGSSVRIRLPALAVTRTN